MDKEHYIDLVKENIELSKILYKVEPENKEKVLTLLEKKQKIIQQNGLFAEFKLKKINKKIEKYIK